MLADLESRKRPVMMIVSLAGSTEFGTVDPIADVHRALHENKSWIAHVWHHVDAACGGFFAALAQTPSVSVAPAVLGDFAAIREATSVTIDPHKMAYVPYASGVFLCADRRDYPHHRVDAPYIDFDDGSDPGLHTLEGSRAATGAAATWLTGQAIGFDGEGYGRILQRTIVAKQALEAKLKEHFGSRLLVPPGLDLNIICFVLCPEKKLSAMNKATNELFAKSGTPQLEGYSVSKTAMKLDSSRMFLREWLIANGIEIDDDRVALIRSCLMNPFLTSRQAKVDFLPDFIKAIDRASQAG
jgi:glutamate/tyrosine decarboxylase-like PLP-dependent enzyme